LAEFDLLLTSVHQIDTSDLYLHPGLMRLIRARLARRDLGRQNGRYFEGIDARFGLF